MLLVLTVISPGIHRARLPTPSWLRHVAQCVATCILYTHADLMRNVDTYFATFAAGAGMCTYSIYMLLKVCSSACLAYISLFPMLLRASRRPNRRSIYYTLSAIQLAYST
jgi:hypothetical protein